MVCFADRRSQGKMAPSWHSPAASAHPPTPCCARLSEALRQTCYSAAHLAWPVILRSLALSVCRTSGPDQALSKKFSPLKRR